MEFPDDGIPDSLQSQSMKDELLGLLFGRDELQNGSRDLSQDERLLRLYSEGLSSTRRLNADSFHKVVIKALQVSAHGWPSTTRECVRDALVDSEEAFGAVLLQSHTREERLRISNQAIDFALRTWLMLDCSDLDTSGVFFRWPADMSLREFVNSFVNSCFSARVSYQDDAIKKFPRKFTARHLEKIAGINIRWTDFLSDHLVFSEADGTNGTLKVFKHKKWLMEMATLPSLIDDGLVGSHDQDYAVHAAASPDSKKQATDGNIPQQRFQCGRSSASSPAPEVGMVHVTPTGGDGHKSETTSTMPACGLPRQLIMEILLSLELLCPTVNHESVDWLREKGMDFPQGRVDGKQHPSYTPRLREFTYLRERLLDLVEEYQAPPRHWKNVFTDRRNPTTFYTFWIGAIIAVLTLLFGIGALLLAGLTLDKTP